jgi:hypothetical protein
LVAGAATRWFGIAEIWLSPQIEPRAPLRNKISDGLHI